jgi:hypothetical protein
MNMMVQVEARAMLVGGDLTVAVGWQSPIQACTWKSTLDIFGMGIYSQCTDSCAASGVCARTATSP